MNTAWKTSSYSGASGECVEARFTGQHVGVRDSKSPHLAELAFGPDQWALLTRSA
ncbi:DUF397 domain-containing protein [Nocardiopsis synnemataformans]|uniref:DUF397 domain-containing protein n=1 Tax=Nocardiopsis synnemataformans TaxID=61305 RepID=UPI003EB7EAEE